MSGSCRCCLVQPRSGISVLQGGEDVNAHLVATVAPKYTVGASPSDGVTIWTGEVWDDRAHRGAALGLPEVRAAIASAMPMLTGEFTVAESGVRGSIDH